MQIRKVFISPTFNGPDAGDGGIRRVIEAMRRHLPTFGWQVVSDQNEADLINCHGAALVDYPANVPMIASSHGLYWSNYKWPDEFYPVNQMVIETMVRAQQVTAPSRWVAHALRYGLTKPITAIHHGIDPDDWAPGNNGGYILWNKARSDVISNPADLMQLSETAPDLKFLTTLGEKRANVQVAGRMPYDQMKALIQHAGVYLATARETFGIGTLEAMACGVPVVGWDFGGQQEIIKQCETGILVPYGDYSALAEACRQAMSKREQMGEAARADVVARWQWVDKISQYAALFDEVLADWHKPRPKVSIIVTAHNLAQYLGQCLESVKQQDFEDWECVIVNDASSDGTRQIGRRWCYTDTRFVYRETAKNVGLSGARNFGVAHSKGRYIIPLDADDLLTPNGLTPLVKALDEDHGIHIAYGNLRMINEEASQQAEGVSESNEFNWFAQMAHINQPYYCAMMRREVLGNLGGYRVRDWRAEDAAFWCRATSLGYRAEKVSSEPTIYYRIRSDSKSADERKKYADNDGNWCAWYGWKVASTYQAGQEAMARAQVPNPYTVPFGAQGKPPSNYKTWNADHRQEPLISVIIPVGPGHGKYLVDALDSLLAQNFFDWEAVVINDSGEALNTSPWPWARVVTTPGGKGAGYARNKGIEAAKGELILFLDGDDWLLSNCLQTMLGAWVTNQGRHYIYSNYQAVDQNGKVKHEKLKPYDQKNWRGQHAINILMSRSDALKIGGFDEDLPGWEDWDYQIKLALAGICGVHVPVETFVYRFHSGQRRQTAADQMSDLLPILKERYRDYYTGSEKLMSCGCGNAGLGLIKAKAAMPIYQTTAANRVRPVKQNGNGVTAMTRMEFTGKTAGTQTFMRVFGQKLTQTYRGGNNPTAKYADVAEADVELLLRTGKWAVVRRPVEAGGEAGAGNVPAPKPINYDEPVQVVEDEPAATPEEQDTEIEATPQAEAEAQAAGLNLADISGTGKDGKITVMDVRNAVREQS